MTISYNYAFVSHNEIIYHNLMLYLIMWLFLVILTLCLAMCHFFVIMTISGKVNLLVVVITLYLFTTLFTFCNYDIIYNNVTFFLIIGYILQKWPFLIISIISQNVTLFLIIILYLTLYYRNCHAMWQFLLIITLYLAKWLARLWH